MRLRIQLLALAALCTAATGQCNTTWSAHPLSTTTNPGRALIDWDPDGSGPLPPQPTLAWFQPGVGSGVLTFDPVNGWQPLGANFDSIVRCLAQNANGDLFAGGNFITTGGVTVNGIARWTGTTWTPLGAGVTNSGFPGTVQTMTALPDGTLFVGGFFQAAGGAAAFCVARWNGTNWLTMGAGTNGDVAASCLLDNGDLIVGGSFSMMDGMTSQRVARWNGTSWSTLGGGVPSYCRDLVVDGAGTTLFAAAGSVMTWDGTTWNSIPSPIASPRAVLPLPGGDILVGGFSSVQRWDGSQWSNLSMPTFGFVDDIAWQSPGIALVVGTFGNATSTPLPSIQALSTNCPAGVTSVGGCSAGVLAARTAAWAGDTLRTFATGLPASSIALVVRGLAPNNVPLPAILPQGLPGCALLASPDDVAVVLPSAGRGSAELAIPTTPAVIGLVVHESWLTLELSPALAILTLGATNGLRATVGVF